MDNQPENTEGSEAPVGNPSEGAPSEAGESTEGTDGGGAPASAGE